PWQTGIHQEWSRMLTFFAWCALFGVAMVILPVGVVGWMIVRRRFSLQTLLWLPVVTAIFLLATMAEPGSDFLLDGVARKLVVAFFTTPPLLALGLVVRWLATWRWRRALVWVSITIVVSAI